jgi:iron complex outermembrane receptor protein
MTDRTHRMHRAGKSLTTLALAVAALLPGEGKAEAGSDAGALDASDPGLEQIIVTARKREESLQRVPVSVTAITGSALDAPFVSDLRDVAGQAPNVVIDSFNAFPNAASISIRGISHTEIEKSFDPAIGVVVDGVFLGTNAQAMIDNFDLERVEVLRGPQGTLFGKNTIGGTVNVMRKRPESSLSGHASYGYSSFDRNEFKAAANLPVANTLALRLAGSHTEGDGWQTNSVDGRKLAGTDVTALRVAGLYTPTPELEVYLNVDVVRDRSPMFGLRNANEPTQLFAQPGLLGLAPEFPGYPADEGPWDDVRSDMTGGTKYDTRQVSLQVDWDVGDVRWTSITGYRWVDEDVHNDFDTEDMAGFNSRREQEHSQFTEELRLTTRAFDRADIVAGVYYYDSDYTLLQTVDLLTDWITCGSLPGGFASFGCRQQGGADQQTTSYAAFATADIDLGERTRLSLGGRYTYETKEFRGTPITFPVGSLGTGRDEDSWSDFTPKLGIDHQLTDGIFVYGSYSRGFKSGGYNGRAGTITSIGPYEPERLDSFELGFKSEWSERRVRLNAAAFYNDYADMQVDLLRAAPGGTGQETVVANAASATTYGVEAELQVRPVQGVSLYASAGWLHASYDEFVADIGLGGTTDNSDLDLRKAPKFQYGLGVDVERALNDRLVWLGSLHFRHSDQMHTTTQNFAFGLRPDTDNLDLSLGLADAEGRWKVTAFGRNVTDERYIIDGLAAGPVLSFTSVNAPRTWGARVEFNF